MDVDQLYQRAIRSHDAGDFAAAYSLYQLILSAHPNHPQALAGLGNLAHRARQHEAALRLLHQSIQIESGDASVHQQLGLVLMDLNRMAEATPALQRAVTLDANFAEAHFYLGNALQSEGRLEESVQAYRRSLAIHPHVPAVLNNLAAALRKSGGTKAAADAYREALTTDPRSAPLHSNLGGVLHELGLYDEAIVEFRKALTLEPNLADAKGSLGLALLLQGNLAEGFRLYESRLAALKARYKDLGRGIPLWDGTPLSPVHAGAATSPPQIPSILLRSEQGFGDTIQFVRYASFVRERVMHVVLQCPPELKRLLSGQLGIEQVVSKTEPIPACDVQCMLMSLPVRFRTTLQTIPNQVPYLRAEPKRLEEFRARIDQLDKETRRHEDTESADRGPRSPRLPLSSSPLNVGLTWAGAPHNKNDRTRSLSLAELSKLFEIPGIQWFSLQKGPAAQELHSNSIANRKSQIPRGRDFHSRSVANITDWTSDLHDFADTAALISALDLVISVDTAVAHLAGALAKPVWVLLPYVPDWRWLLGRSDSPWYPTMRLFRQARLGKWEGVIEEAVSELKKEVEKAGGRGEV